MSAPSPAGLRSRHMAEPVAVSSVTFWWLPGHLSQGLLIWLFKGAFKVSTGIVSWYRSSYCTDVDVSQMASPVPTVALSPEKCLEALFPVALKLWLVEGRCSYVSMNGCSHAVVRSRQNWRKVYGMHFTAVIVKSCVEGSVFHRSDALAVRSGLLYFLGKFGCRLERPTPSTPAPRPLSVCTAFDTHG